MNKQLLAVLMAVVALLPMRSWAQSSSTIDETGAEAYAVLSENESVSNDASEVAESTGYTLTFYYDEQKQERRGMDIGPFSNNTEHWGEHNSEITEVVFDASFANYTSLTSTHSWFYGCSGLTSFKGLENLKTDHVTDMSFMFDMCTALTNLDLSTFNTENVTSMRYMFEECSSLAKLNISSFNTANVTDMGNMFNGCTALSELDVTNFNTSKVTNMYSMFNRNALTVLDLSSFNTEQVTDMGYMFPSGSLTTIYAGAGWNTSHVTNSPYMFSSCVNLVGGQGTAYDANHTGVEYAHIDEGESNPGYFTRSGDSPYVAANDTVTTPYYVIEDDALVLVSDVEGARIHYSMLNPETMPDDDELNNMLAELDVTTENGYYTEPIPMDRNVIIKFMAAREGMANSETVTYVYDNDVWIDFVKVVDRGTDVYERAKGNERVDSSLVQELEYMLDEGVHFYQERFYMDRYMPLQMADRILELCARIEDQLNADDSEIIGGSTEPEAYAVLSDNNAVLTFYYDNRKTERGGMTVEPFDIPQSRGWYETKDSITSVVFDASFANCTSITSTRYWFDQCFNLTSISGLQYLNTSNVTDMDGMFWECSSLTSLDLSNFNTANVTHMNQMFASCSALTALDVSSFDTSNVRYMNMMFANCSGLTTLDLSNFVTSNVLVMPGMFADCSSLTKVDLSSFNTANVWNMESMFNRCSALTTIYIGADWTTAAVTQSSNNMFSGCFNLVGGAGTVYDANHTDHTYAHIDGGASNPGYFTDVNATGIEYAFDDYGVLTVWGETSMAEAVEAAGGRAEVAKTITAVVWQNNQTALTNSDLQGLDNPNMLVFVKSDSLAPGNRDNVVINGFAKNIVLTDATEGNNDFYCPQEFTAEMISYTRNFQQQTQVGVSRGWETIVLPFDVQTIVHEKNGALAPFNSATTAGAKPFWLRNLVTSQGLVPSSRIDKGIPYIISMPNSEEYPDEFNQAGRVTFSSQNVVVPVTRYNTLAADGDYHFRLTYRRLEPSPDVYVLNVGEAQGEHAEGSVFVNNYREIRPFRAYTEHIGNHSAASRYITIKQLGGGTTGIQTIERSPFTIDQWYTLDGRKLQQKPAQKGVYIQNGRKVVIK